jgi:hypothetical protein
MAEEEMQRICTFATDLLHFSHAIGVTPCFFLKMNAICPKG